jgi:hypothetical protein
VQRNRTGSRLQSEVNSNQLRYSSVSHWDSIWYHPTTSTLFIHWTLQGLTTELNHLQHNLVGELRISNLSYLNALHRLSAAELPLADGSLSNYKSTNKKMSSSANSGSGSRGPTSLGLTGTMGDTSDDVSDHVMPASVPTPAEAVTTSESNLPPQGVPNPPLTEAARTLPAISLIPGIPSNLRKVSSSHSHPGRVKTDILKHPPRGGASSKGGSVDRKQHQSIGSSGSWLQIEDVVPTTVRGRRGRGASSPSVHRPTSTTSIRSIPTDA